MPEWTHQLDDDRTGHLEHFEVKIVNKEGFPLPVCLGIHAGYEAISE